MAYNLLEEPWLFVRRRESGPARIAPWGIVANILDDTVVNLDFPRADLNGGVVQFLIGLMQTAFAPADEKAWRRLWNAPPAPDELRTRLAAQADAFFLDGDGPRFMQDLTLTPAEAGASSRVAALFVETPGDKALRDNTDFFIKRGRVERLCPACAAAALFTLQTNAPSGGVGHRTGLRGGGPLTTLALPAGVADDTPQESPRRAVQTLWHTVWANVFPETVVGTWRDGGPFPREFGVFPWLAPTRTSEKGQAIHPGQVDPLHAYWGMPRRIRLEFEPDHDPAPCDLCGQAGAPAVTGFRAKNYGTNYGPSWRHPLTPYSQTKGGLLSLKGTPEGVGYRLWRGAVVAEGDGGREPARIVAYAMNKRMEQLDPDNGVEFRLWAFGPDMDNMKARSWDEGTMPVLAAPANVDADRYFQEVLRLVQAAEAAARALRQAVRYGLYEKADPKVDANALQTVGQQFWALSGAAFHAGVVAVGQALAEVGQTEDARRAWLCELRRTALTIYRRTRDAVADWKKAPQEIVNKEKWLSIKLTAADKEMAQALGLPMPEKKPARRGRGKAA
ncbi:hypothetical protein JCM15519_10210 [Fundidesulfovibrio butyratiphilus]